MFKQLLTFIVVISGCLLAPPAIPGPILEGLSSAEWAALFAEEDRRIDAEIVICRGCFPEVGDNTGSLAAPSRH
jgi:hypothetical protein